jgi:hypothetical protein
MIDRTLHDVQKELEVCRQDAKRVGLAGVLKRLDQAIEELNRVRKLMREGKS